MGMTIDDVIRYIKDLRDARGCGYQQANVAIDTMRKYQKIEQIINAPMGGTSARYNAIVNLVKYGDSEV